MISLDTLSKRLVNTSSSTDPRSLIEHDPLTIQETILFHLEHILRCRTILEIDVLEKSSFSVPSSFSRRRIKIGGFQRNTRCKSLYRSPTWSEKCFNSSSFLLDYVFGIFFWQPSRCSSCFFFFHRRSFCFDWVEPRTQQSEERRRNSRGG